MLRWFLILFAGLLTGCGYNSWEDYGPEQIPLPSPNMRIATLRSTYRDHPVKVTGNVVIGGTVITSDRENNFYRTFIIEDETGAVEIRAGMYDLHNTYRLGQEVVVMANSLMVGMYNGLLQLGVPGTDQTPVEYMNHKTVADRYVYRMDIFTPPVPTLMTIPQLEDAWIGRLVRIENLTLDPVADTTWALPALISPTGTPRNVSLKFKTPANDSIYVFTSGYASFAGERVPLEALSVTGILLAGKVNGKEIYELKMRDLSDVQRE